MSTQEFIIKRFMDVISLYPILFCLIYVFYNMHTVNYDYSLLAFFFRLPNKTIVKRFAIDHWDFLYLHRPLYRVYDRLNDRELWNPTSFTIIDTIKLKILDKLFNR